MPYAIEQKWIGLAKEMHRGVAVTPPTKYIAVAPDSEADYKENLIDDENVRGLLEAKFPPSAGIKEGSLKLSGINVQSDNIGEILNSLLGACSTTSPTTGVYDHVFTRDSNLIQMPSYSVSINRGLNAKVYNLGVVKSLALSGSVDGKLNADVDFLFQTEASYPTPPTPTWVNPTPFMFYNTTFKIAGVSSLVVKDWTLNVDNQSFGQRVQNQSQDIKDVLTFAKILTTGSFNLYIEDEVERAKFLANTASSFEIDIVGTAIGSTGYSNTLKIVIPEIHYTALPFGNLDGLLGSPVAFNAYYNLSAGKSIGFELINGEATY